jgi:hypothetical protein
MWQLHAKTSNGRENGGIVPLLYYNSTRPATGSRRYAFEYSWTIWREVKELWVWLVPAHESLPVICSSRPHALTAGYDSLCVPNGKTNFFLHLSPMAFTFQFHPTAICTQLQQTFQEDRRSGLHNHHKKRIRKTATIIDLLHANRSRSDQCMVQFPQHRISHYVVRRCSIGACTGILFSITDLARMPKWLNWKVR